MARPAASPDKADRAVPYSAPALEKGFDVVELLATAPDGLTIKDIAERLGRSMSELFRMIMVMDQRGWLAKDTESDRYRVTYKVLELAMRATPAQELAQVATPVMYALAHQIGQSCHVVVQSGTRALIVQRQENPGPTGHSVRLGTSVDLVASSSGHVLLAFSDEDRLARTMRELELTPERLAQVQAMIACVRKQGYEMMDSARVSGVRDISYPVFAFDGRVAAALTMPFLTFIDGSQLFDVDGARQRLAAAAQQVSQGLGWTPPS